MPKLANFAEANQYMSRFYNNSRTEYTLDNMRQMMVFLGNPQDKLRVVHVAGTSGKTSTAYYIAALLTAGGYNTGLTVSPHVDQLNERVQINGQPISETKFCDSLSEFLEIIQKCPVEPSWFEVIVAYVYWYFSSQKVDYAVVEVGLGGQKDGTNVVTRPDKVCVLTDIGLDHVGILGDSLGEIAAQKIGIAQPTNTIFTYQQPQEVMDVYTATSNKLGAKLNIVGRPTYDTSSVPRYQQRNWLLAYKVYEFLQNRDNLRHLTSQVLRETKQILIPGRMEAHKIENKTVIMDGAHNAQKMAAFIASYKKLFPETKPAILLGVKEGKEYKELIPLLKPFAESIITTSFESSQDLPIKSMPAQKLADAFGKTRTKVRVIDDHDEAYKTLLKSSEEVLVVTGSFYLLGQIRKHT